MVSKFSKLINVCRKQLRALDVIFQIDLLILGMGAVVAWPDRQQDHVLTGHFLQRQGDWNGAAFAGQVRLYSPNGLKGCLGYVISILQHGLAEDRWR